VSSSEQGADVPKFQARYEPESVADVPEEVFDCFLFPLDGPDSIEALDELVAGLPAALTPVATAFSRSLESVVSVGTLPYQMAAAAVAQRRFDRLWIAEQIRARKHMDEAGNIPDSAKSEALATAKKRFEEEMQSRETADVMANHVLTTLSEGITRDATFHSACDEEQEPGAAMLGLPPTGRVARPDDVARLALFFASEQSDHVTGQAWNVDGGAVMH
jgi:NAD(P)-dependent dehydrogenase (short-subunit alcohol dehydrogenase family)